MVKADNYKIHYNIERMIKKKNKNKKDLDNHLIKNYSKSIPDKKTVRKKHQTLSQGHLS